MFLKRLDTVGFKSFAERITVDFVPGVTAVVGPNGSGKSNITDAIRWVLGEQSARSLRGSKMEDIIFAGSDTRKGLNVAEVTLTLDNEDHALPIDYQEVSVTRRVYRSGESEFLINKQPCRLKDIVDLFMDSGLGREAFSIISQGKVEEILSSKAEERRSIFEEAAGVLKYKHRKKKAEYKLAETQENLNRVEDITHEIEGQLEPLKEQAAVAKDYLEKKDQLEQHEVSLLVTEIEMLHKEWEALLDDLERKKDEEMKLNAELQKEEANLEQERSHVHDLDESIEGLQETLLILTQELENIAGKRELLKERHKHYEENKQKLMEERSVLKDRKDTLQSGFNKESKKLQQYEEASEESNKALSETKAKLINVSVNTEGKIEELKTQYIEKLNEQAANRNEQQSNTRQLEQIKFKEVRLKEKFQDLIKDRERILNEKIKIEGIVVEQQSQRDSLENEAMSLSKELEQDESNFKVKESKLYEGYQHIEKLRSKKEMLEEMKEDFAGFFYGVKEILKARERSELSGIHGAIAELIDIPNDYLTSIETALGGQAQHIVVNDEGAARNAIAWLKKTNKGRATFLPLSSIQPKQVPQHLITEVDSHPGYIGIAANLVSYNNQFQKAIDFLVGNVVIAKTLKDANEIAAKLQRRYRVVTLDGDVVSPGGSMSGGAHKKNSQSVFTREKELNELSEKLVTFETKAKQFEETVKELKASLDIKKKKLDAVNEALSNARYQVQEDKSKLREIEIKEQNLNDHLKIYDQEKSQFETDLKELSDRQETIAQQLSDLDSTLTLIQTNIDRLSAEQLTKQSSQEDYQQQLNDIQVTLAEQNAQLSNQQEKVETLKSQLNEVSQALVRNERSLKQLMDVQESDETEESLTARINIKRNHKEETTLLIQDRRKERHNRSERIENRERELKEVKRLHQGLTQDIQQREVRTNRLDVELENRLEQLRIEYTLTFEKARDSYPKAEDIEAAKQEVKLIKRSINELGTVNIGSIEQFERIKERYEFLTEQQVDLNEAKATLFSVIAEMDEEMTLRFEGTFVQIREEFTKVFIALFGGGRADLKLTNPEDLLETGVDIVAQPPGKKLQHLGLLSGGERALTAIALLFAILRVRPVPFCVLDEVEAALDDANVNRFASYLKEFSANTQFIVITHRKGTMEEADVLYGVTMQESGVSKLVSVRLEETKEMLVQG